MVDRKNENKQHRVSELAGVFAGTSLPLSADEITLVDAWDRMTADVVGSKFDCVLSSAYDSATFDGLNASLTEKYLSDDPLHAFGMPDVMLRGGTSSFAGDWAPDTGYGWFDFGENEGLILEDDDFFEDTEVREEIAVQRQRRQSLFGPRQPRAKGQPAAPSAIRRPQTGRARAAALRAERRAQAPTAAAGGVDAPSEAGALVSMPSAAEVRHDPAWVSAYPRRLGRAGATMLTRPQRNASRMLSASKGSQRSAALTRIASTLTANERLTGPSIGRVNTPGTAPVWSPMVFDASLGEEGMPIVTRAGALASSFGEGAADAQAALTVAGMDLRAGMDLSDPASYQASAAQAAPGRSTVVMLDGLAINREQLPALSGAIDVAMAAFGADAPAPAYGTPRSRARMGGVFNASRMDSSLKVVTIAGEVAAPTSMEPELGYHGMLYDAADHTWIAPDAGGFVDAGLFDAAEPASSVARPGRTVPTQHATARLVAGAMPTDATARAARRMGAAEPGQSPRVTAAIAAAEQAAARTPAPMLAQQRANLGTPSQQGRAAEALSSIGPVVAPIREITSDNAAAFATSVTQIRRDSAVSRSARQRAAAPGNGVRLETLIPAAGRARRTQERAELASKRASNFGSNAAAIGSGGLVFGSPEAAADAALANLQPGTRSGAAIGGGHFTGMVGKGTRRMGVTSSPAEMFAAARLEQATGRRSLVPPAQAPVSIAGEVHYGYGSMGSPMDDPVLYVQLQQDAAEQAANSYGSLRSDPTPRVSAARAMSPSVADSLNSVSMPLSSAARLAGALTTMAAHASVSRQFDGATATSPSPATAPAVGASRRSIGFDASTIRSLAGSDTTPGGYVTTGGRVLRTADGITSRHSALRVGEDFTPAGTTLAEATTTPAALSLAARSTGRVSDAEFYQFSYDAETALITPDMAPEVAAAIAGGHVEMRNGRLVRSVPSSPAAQRIGASKPVAAAKRSASAASTPMLAGLKQSIGARQAEQRIAELRAEGIVPAQT
ncbi:MAG: hypothetical protein ACI9WU_004600, partial [Myxococcota bacterium]